MMKKIGPLKIVHKFGQNAYEVELPPSLAISPILNICGLYPYKGESQTSQMDTTLKSEQDWVKDLAISQPVQLESILDNKVIKKTRKGIYKHYLVKWVDLLDSKAMWMS